MSSEVATKPQHAALPKPVQQIATDRKIALDYLAQGEKLFSAYRHKFRDLADETRFDAIDLMIKHAKTEFGGRLALDITRDMVIKLVCPNKYDGPDIREVSVGDIWRAIEAEFGGNAGIDRAKQELAIALIKHFGIAHEPPTFKKDCLVINDSVYLDTYYTKPKLSYSSQQAVVNLYQALIQFCELHDKTQLAHQIKTVLAKFSSWSDHTVVVSREKFEVWDADLSYWLKVVTYASRFEYTFSPALAGIFQQFIAEHGASYLAERQ